MFALFTCLICLPTLLLFVEFLAERRDRRRFPAPGKLLSDSNLHVVEMGAGAPTVILESGLASSSISWVQTQRPMAEFFRVIAYDRAGLGWSSPPQSPLTLRSLLSNLDAVAQASQVSTPMILVGHSFGGLLVRAFANIHPNRVGGIVLIDPVSLATFANPDSEHRNRLQYAIRLSKRGAFLAHLAIVRGALSLVSRGIHKLPSLIGRIPAGKGSSVMNRLATEVVKLPAETHGPIRSHWSRPASFRLMAEYLRLLPLAASEAQMMPIPSHIPVIVLSAASAKPSELAERELWASAHHASRHTVVPNTTHWLQLNRPDLVIEAVRELALLIQ